jgi:hypothetical protein
MAGRFLKRGWGVTDGRGRIGALSQVFSVVLFEGINAEAQRRRGRKEKGSQIGRWINEMLA